MGMVPRVLSCALMFGVLSGPVALPRSAQSAMEARGAAASSKLTQLAQLTVDEHAEILGTGLSAQERNEAIPISSAAIEELGGFQTGGKSAANVGTALQCLTQAIYYEAANEPVDGKRAVAQVVLNRVRHPAYPSSVCGVVYDGWSRPVCQFSFVCDGSLRRTPLADRWNQSRAVARAALAGYVEKTVGTATHYHADYVLPRWAYELSKVRRIGRHLFYRFPGNGGRAASFSARWNGVEHIPQINFARFDAQKDDYADADVAVAADPWDKPDPTDRRAANDIGGRMNPDKGWRLAIPDPVDASASYRASLQEQGGQPHLARADADSATGGITP